MENISKIKFLFDRDNYTLDFNDSTIDNRQTYACFLNDVVYKFDKQMFLSEFEKFDVDSWDDVYEGDPFSDERWQLEIIYKDEDKKFFKHGKANFPPKFFDFVKLFEKTHKEAVEEHGGDEKTFSC